MTRRPAGTSLAAVVAALVVLAACGDDDEPAPAVAPPSSEPAGTEPEPAEPPSSERAGTEPAPAEPAGTEPVPSDVPLDDRFPDVVGATATMSGDGWRFDVTISSPYDTPQRYADAWRILGPDGTELGVRLLAHDHQNEQPFTRSLSGVEIPDTIETVTIEGRDQVYGWGGDVFELTLDR